MLSLAPDYPSQLADALRTQFASRWRIEIDQQHISVHPRRAAPNARPPRRSPNPAHLVATMARTFDDNGIPTDSLLPMRWGRDTDLTISAVQALDPWLKDGANRVWREGFLPQPVVRFTGERDNDGRLQDGYLTSFINLSCVQRITGTLDHAQLIDTWISALSAIGIHAGRLALSGDLTVWHRGPVSGITLFFSCDGAVFADAVLLWHTARPECLATDIGSGAERLAWILSRDSWATTVFGQAAADFGVDVADAVRTATLLVMAGIRPEATGPGSALRRVLRSIPATMAAAGLGRIVRAQRAYWAAVGMAGPGWPDIATAIEDEVLSTAYSRTN